MPANLTPEYKEADNKWIPILKDKLELVYFPKSEGDRLVAMAESVYERWAEEMERQHLPGRDVLSYYLRKRGEIPDYDVPPDPPWKKGDNTQN